MTNENATSDLSKTEAAYQTLRRELLSGRLQPGAPLRINALREAYGFGWTPLREALSRLDAERLVTAESNRGFSVAPVSPESLADLTRTRLLIELALLRESITRGDAEWEERVAMSHFRLSRCIQLLHRDLAIRKFTDDDLEEWARLHLEFHITLLSAAASHWLKRFYLDVMVHLERHQRVLMVDPTLRRVGDATDRSDPFETMLRALSLEEHRALMDAAIDRDTELACRLMTEHVGSTADVMADLGKIAPSSVDPAGDAIPRRDRGTRPV